ncbi:hypothetical protein BKA57DRAFT_510143 [Linnemannia elongata]|nr:hypothetical protein BKA57DRAFT_510143 [Linnemannia elongata]
MSLGNNSTCILTQEGNDDHDDDDDDDDEDACDTNAMNVINGDGCVFISGDRPPSPVALPSPAMSESNGPPQQQRQQESIDITSSNTSLSSVYGIDQQGLQFSTVVPYSSFRDSGHFPTQVFIMEYEEQHVIVVDETDMQELELQTAIRPFSPTTTASLLVHNDDSAPMISSPSSAPRIPLTTRHFVSLTVITPVSGVSPPMAAPLALISRVHIETNASSTTLVSVSGPTTTATMAGWHSTPSTPTTPTTTSWGPSSLFKGWLPSKRKNKSGLSNPKEKTTYETDGRLSPEASEVLITSKEEGNEVVVLKEKEHSVAVDYVEEPIVSSN